MGYSMASNIDDQLEFIDMEDWLSYEGIEYRVTRGSSGTQLNVKCCPACGKEEWKVFLNAETALGNCFSGSCSKGTFNKFSFIREHLLNTTENVSMNAYVKAYAREVGWRPKRIQAAEVEMANINLELPPYFAIPIKGMNVKYLQNRNIDIETARYFNLGYIKDGYFAKRIFIPIHDLDGTLVSFQARDITGKSDKKYLFPKGFASTGKILYNGNNFVRSASAVLVEGVFDAIGTKVSFDTDRSLFDVAILASFGMHLSGGLQGGQTDDQLSRFITLKERGLKNLTIMWDGERKALLKALSTAKLLKGVGLNVKIAELPENRDPSDIDAETLKHCYFNAKEVTNQYELRIKLS